jgi:hypothetical protein
VRRAAALALAAIAAVSCGSAASYARAHRDALLVAYPPGETTRGEVRARWGSAPDLWEARPPAGWSAARAPAVGTRALESERRTGKAVALVERYSGPDPGASSFLALCHGWFFYDDADRLIDVDWQYMSD